MNFSYGDKLSGLFSVFISSEEEGEIIPATFLFIWDLKRNRYQTGPVSFESRWYKGTATSINSRFNEINLIVR